MDTEKLLRRKALISCIYLLLAFASFLLPLLAKSEAFSIHYTDFVSGDRPRSGYYDTFFAFQTLIIWAAAGFFFGHFLRGAIYYPRFYEENLRRQWSEKKITDYSRYRGLAGTALVGLYFYIVTLTKENVPLQLKEYFWFYLSAWLLFNSILSHNSQTATWFKYKEVIIDPAIIDPKGEKYKDRINPIIGFYLIRRGWEERAAIEAVKAYLRDLSNQISVDAVKERNAKAKIRDFSSQVLAYKEK